MAKKNIVIVGGGITGLSAAYHLQKEIKRNQLDYRVQLVEASDRVGGKIQSVKQDGHTIELGPDSLLSRKPAAIEMVKELGLENEVVRNATGQSYLLIGKKLHKMPKGAYMGVPMKVGPLLRSDIFTMCGKVRALMDLVIPRSRQKGDMALGEFMRRRFGNELVDKQIDPLLSGIHSGDIDQMSLDAIYPLFRHAEQEYGSLMKGLKKTIPQPSKKKKSKTPSTGVFLSFKDGLETLVKALESQLEQDTVLLNRAVDHIEKKEAGYHVLLNNGDVLQADAMILATGHNQIPRMLSQYEFLKQLNDIPLTSTANVVMGFDQSQIKKDINGTGYLVSRKSNYRITACTWTHRKWPNTTPDGKALFRCYVGKPDDQDVVHQSDRELVDIALNDMKKTMKLSGEPEFYKVTRYIDARPQYHVGHLELIANVQEAVRSELPGVTLVGSSYNGVGIPDCLEHGKNGATAVIEHLKQ